MANIKFNYLYRDGGNYKNYGSVVFTGPGNLSLKELFERVRTKGQRNKDFFGENYKTHPFFAPEVLPVCSNTPLT